MAIDTVTLPIMKKKLRECDRALEKIQSYKYPQEEDVIIYMMKCWTDLTICNNFMYDAVKSLEKMSFINVTEERLSLLFVFWNFIYTIKIIL